MGFPSPLVPVSRRAFLFFPVSLFGFFFIFGSFLLMCSFFSGATDLSSAETTLVTTLRVHDTRQGRQKEARSAGEG